MTISWFLVAEHPHASLDGTTSDGILDAVRATQGVRQALLFTPTVARDPYLDDGRAPMFALELAFAAIEELEAALACNGALHRIPAILAATPGVRLTEQAMLARSFAVPSPVFQTAPESLPCTYLVAYEGRAADLNAWLGHYIAHHPPIMARFPGIRAIAIYTRLDWCSALPATRGDAFQRNKVVFDDAESLQAALNSAVRDEMRADFHRFPPFDGRNTHYAMHTTLVTPRA
ncbi:MAG: hypothetical protein JO326_03420 [Acetobacteraceae bacterium]|nr:hypothetical protein [Acetobacteraceae bacterium]